MDHDIVTVDQGPFAFRDPFNAERPVAFIPQAVFYGASDGLNLSI